METVSEYNNTNENVLKRNTTLTLRSQLSLSNQKKKYKNNYLHLNSLQKNTIDTCETTGISRINSINPSNIPISIASNKKPKGRVAFAPKFRLINYVYYDPKETILKVEENNFKGKKEEKKEDKLELDKKQNIEANDKVIEQCTCLLM